MAKVIVQHHVADFDTWLAVYAEHEAVRREHGGTGHAISRSVSDPNDVVIVNEFGSLEGAQRFAQDPSLPEAMHRAGVDSEPRVWIVEDADIATY